jgi:predicted site-specific integrase-resolvase
MIYYSTREAAKKLGIPYTTLATYISVGKIQGPQTEIKGKTTAQIWTEEEIENVRKLLPKIANGRKTRYSKLREKQTAQPKKAVPRKTKAKKKT